MPDAVHIPQSPARCPYCHDTIARAEFQTTRVCADCLARHHSDCWEGACASCASTRALLQPADPDAASGSLDRLHRLLSRAAVGLTAAYFGLMVAGVVAMAIVGFKDVPGEGPPWFVWPGLIAGFALSAVLLPLPFLQVRDALRRRKVDSSCGKGALVCAAIPWLTAGVSAVIYYWLWGRHPLAAESGSTPEQAPLPEPAEGAPRSPSKLKE